MPEWLHCMMRKYMAGFEVVIRIEIKNCEKI